MSDLIDRQLAINAVINLCANYTPTKSVLHPHRNFVIEELEKLPSAHPKISCDGCKYQGWPTAGLPCCGCIRKESNDYYDSEE